MNSAAGLMAARVWMNVCNFASFIVAGRVLTPADFGIYAAASSAVFLFMMVVGAGFTEHVLGRDHGQRDEGAAFWCSAATGLVGALAAVTAAAWSDISLNNHVIAIVLYLLAPVPLLWGLSVIQEATLIRDGRGGELALILFVAEMAGMISLLACLFTGFGLYSLAIGRLANVLVCLISYSLISQTRIFTPIDWRAVRSMARFSLGVLGARFVQWIDGYGSDLILFTRLSAAEAGHYRMAARLGAAPASIFFQAPGPAQIAYIGKRYATEPKFLGRAMTRAIRLHLSLAAPIFAILSVCAVDLVHLLLGEAWKTSGYVFAVLCAPAGTGVWIGAAGAALMAQGLSRRFLTLQTLSAAFGTLALIIGVNWGVVAAAVAKAGSGTGVALMSLFWVPGLSSKDRMRIIRSSLGIAVAALACAGAAGSVLMFVHRPDAIVPALARLVASGVAGLAVYVVILKLAAPATFMQLAFIARRAQKNRVRSREERLTSGVADGPSV